MVAHDRGATTRRVAAGLAAVVLLMSGAVAPVLGEQATFGPMDAEVDAGDPVERTLWLYIGAAGIPNVTYENAESFASGETVTATIRPVVHPEGFGTVELISDPTLVGTTSRDWKTGEYGEFGEIHFAPEVTLRFRAPTSDELGCADAADKEIHGRFGILADFVGDAGTRAHMDPTVGGQGWIGADVYVTVRCPPTEPTPPPSSSALPPSPVATEVTPRSTPTPTPTPTPTAPEPEVPSPTTDRDQATGSSATGVDAAPVAPPSAGPSAEPASPTPSGSVPAIAIAPVPGPTDPPVTSTATDVTPSTTMSVAIMLVVASAILAMLHPTRIWRRTDRL